MQFNFQPCEPITEHFNSFSEFKKYIKWQVIQDEYGATITPEDFISLLKTKKKNHPFAHKDLEHRGKYIDGYYFLNSDFS